VDARREPVDERAEASTITETRDSDAPVVALELSAAGLLPTTAPTRGRWHDSSALHAAGLVALELFVIFAWTLIVTRPYLNLDPLSVPVGREYLHHISANELWTWVRACGGCAFWNGNVRGGYPAFADVQESMLHPLVILTTLAFGVVNGSKMALAGAFLMAGLAQWWLGRVLALSPVSRVWAACVAVAGGQLAGRMEHGIFGLVIAVAACSLVLPALIVLGRSGTRRAAAVLGAVLALAIYAGQGYMQIGLLLCLPTLTVFFLGNEAVPPALLARRYLQAAGLALLLSAPFLLPMLHFLPQMAKNIDPALVSAQPFGYVPFNLVVNDFKFYNSDALNKIPYPWLYVYYIGWLPVLLAVWGLADRRPTAGRRVTLYLALFAAMALWLASGTLLSWTANTVQVSAVRDFIYGIRYPTLFTGLAVPAILGLAGVGLDRLLHAPWLRVRLSWAAAGAPGLTLNLAWLLVIPLAVSLSATWSFNRQWILSTPLSPGVYQVVESLRTSDLQWVNTPFGEQYWVEPAISRGLKLAIGTMGWAWRNHDAPEAEVEAGRGAPPPGMTLITTTEQINSFKAPPGREYAAVNESDGSRIVCSAHGIGGQIDVTCQTLGSGVLTVKENMWTGWQAWIDGLPAGLLPGRWLSVGLPAGQHLIQFRYRPWDVPLGLVLGLAGLALAVYFFWFARD
jgi:hypothetical protein